MSRLLLTLVLMFAPLMAVAEVCPRPVETPESAKPFVNRGHEKRFANDLNRIEHQIRTDRYPVVALGDSIMHRWPQDMLERATGAKTLNAGISGDTAAAVLWRLRGEPMPAIIDGERKELGTFEWSRQSPRYVLILVGTNDGHRHASCDVFHGIIAVVGKAQQVFPSAKIIVFSILPRGTNMLERDAEIRQTNAALKEAAPSAGFSFLDAHAAFLCGNRTPCDLVMGRTQVHPSLRGYLVLGNLLEKHLGQAQLSR